jgi:hypothetical protein
VYESPDAGKGPDLKEINVMEPLWSYNVTRLLIPWPCDTLPGSLFLTIRSLRLVVSAEEPHESD